jgi:hypothetical protein
MIMKILFWVIVKSTYKYLFSFKRSYKTKLKTFGGKKVFNFAPYIF